MSKIYTAEFIQNESGKLIKRDFYLPDIKSVRKEIADHGGTPLLIKEKKRNWWQKEWFSHNYKTRFLKSVSLHVTGGFSAEKALMLTIQSETNPSKRRELQPAVDVLNGGGSFYDAISQLRIFNNAITLILKAGEIGGFMREAVKLAIENMEQSKKNIKMFVSWLGILAIDFATAISFAVLFQFWFIPWLEKNGIQSTDPLALEKFHNSLAMAKNVNGILLGIIVMSTIFAILAVYIMLTQKNLLQKKIEILVAKIPVVKSFIYDGEISTTFNVVAKMIKRGIRMDVAFSVAEQSAILPAIKTFWRNAYTRLMQGDSVGRALDSQLLNHAERLEINAHQDSSQLSAILEYISEERNISYQSGVKKVIYFSLLFVVLYSIAIGFVGVKLLQIQNAGMMEGFKSISGGGLF